MSLYIRGAIDSANQARFDWDAATTFASGQRPTVAAGIWRVKLKNVATITGDTAQRIAGPSPDTTSDFGIQIQAGTAGATAVNVRVRTNLNVTHNSAFVEAPLDEEIYLGVRINYVGQTLTFYHADGQLGDVIALGAGDGWRSSTWQPFIRGRRADSKDIEFEEVAYWHNANDLAGNADSYVPTHAQMLAYVPGQSLSGLPARKSEVRPTGTNGAVASTFADLVAGGRVFNRTSGQSSGIYAPTFVSTVVPDVTGGAIELSSRSVEFAYSLAVTGTAHLMIGVASANASDPTPGQVKLGQNQNGTGATAKEAFVESTTGIKERRLTGTSASVAYKAFLTVETATNVFTPMVSWTFTTPRIGVRSSVNYINEAAPALWANETAVNVSVAAEGQIAFVGAGETGADGRLVADLSEEAGVYLPVGASVKMAWEKGIYHGSETVSIVNLEA